MIRSSYLYILDKNIIVLTVPIPHQESLYHNKYFKLK